jgi:hypothetical protein
VNLDAILTLLLWPLIGLVAWWARDRARLSGPLWLAIHLVVGPFMLLAIAWRFITAPHVASVAPVGTRAANGAGGSGAGGSGAGGSGAGVSEARRRANRRRADGSRSGTSSQG